MLTKCFPRDLIFDGFRPRRIYSIFAPKTRFSAPPDRQFYRTMVTQCPQIFLCASKQGKRNRTWFRGRRNRGVKTATLWGTKDPKNRKMRFCPFSFCSASSRSNETCNVQMGINFGAKIHDVLLHFFFD